MRKLQKTQLLIRCATILCCTVISVFSQVKAEASETAFTNLNGVVLSQEQYSRLLKYFDTDTINTMSKSLLDSVKNDNSLEVAADQERYIRQDTVYDKSGNVISESETDISAEDAYCMRTPAVRRSSSTSYSTSVKKIHLRVVGASSCMIITMANTWITMPSTKSYDVIAVRPVIKSVPGSIINHIDQSSLSGYQKYNNGQMVTYSGKSNNVKISNILTGVYGGVGISMNIPDSASSSLSSSMTVKLMTGANTITVYGTYQHAKSSVSLSDSKSYSFDPSGLGGVVKFNSSSISNKYDGMSGVHLTYKYGDEVYD